MIARLDQVLEVKWDGIRAQLRIDRGRVTLRTRPGRDATAEFPELRGLGEALRARRVVLDAELVSLGVDGHPDFGAIAARLGRRHRVVPDPAIVLQLFDVLHVDGRAVRALPYGLRRELLDELGGQLPEMARVPRTFALDQGLETATREMGLEGVVAKRVDLPYRPGRRDGSWTKLKHRRSERLAVVGWRRRDRGDELLVADLDGRRRGWCAFGLSGETRRRIADDARDVGSEQRGEWIAPAPLLIVDVSYQHPYTRDGHLQLAAARARRRERAQQLAEQLNSQLRLRFRTGDDSRGGRLRVASELLDSDYAAHRAAGRQLYAEAKRAERLVERDERLRAGQHPGNADGRYRAACTYAERWGLQLPPGGWTAC